MTDDRASLGARIAEAMGWAKCDQLTHRCWRRPDGEHVFGWNPESLVTWEGYGEVDAWMREQGYSRCTWRYPRAVSVAYYKPAQMMMDNMVELDTPDEPLAALQAALKALEARE